MLLSKHIERRGLTFGEAAAELRAAAAGTTICRASVFYWANGRHAPSRSNAAVVETWAGIPPPAWDEPAKVLA